MRPSVSPAACCRPAEVVASEPVASLMAPMTAPMVSPNSAIAWSICLRRFARVSATNCRCRVPVIAASHMIAWRDQLGVGGDRRRREPVVPRDHVGQPAHDHAAGVEPHARFHADRGMLARRILAVLGIGVVELAREQVPVLRQFELADAGAVLGEVGRDLRNLRCARDEGVDRRRQMRLQDRPQPLQPRRAPRRRAHRLPGGGPVRRALRAWASGDPGRPAYEWRRERSSGPNDARR